MKIKYLSGKKVDQIVDVDDAVAKGLIDDEMAVEVKEADALDTAMKGLNDRITSAVETAVAGVSEKLVKGLDKVKPQIVVGNDRSTLDPTGGFKSYGHFASQVVKFAKRGETDNAFDAYMKSAAAVAQTEGSAPDAGPTVPVAYLPNLLIPVGNPKNFLDAAKKVPMATANTLVPVLKNYVIGNTDPTKGLVVTQLGENTVIPQSKLAFEQLSLTLKKEAILVPVSDELLSDNIVSLDAVLNDQATDALQRNLNAGVINGSAAMTGIVGSAATVTVNRSTAGTAIYADMFNVYAHFDHDNADYNSAVWYIHPTVISALGTMTSGTNNMFIPPGGLQDGSVGRILGRPIVVTALAKPLGTAGDIILADMSKYYVGFKGGVNAASSIHLFFDSDVTAFRYTLRICGKPGYSAPVSLEDGFQVSPFVVLN